MAEEEVDTTSKGAFALAIVLALAAVVIDIGVVAWLLGPIVLLLLFFVMSRVRLLYSLLGVMFISLTIENPDEAPAAGMWKSPLYNLGVLLMVHLNTPTGISWLSFSGTDIMLMFLMARTVLRGRALDGMRVTVPRPLVQLAWLSLAGAGFVWARGLISGGDFQKSLWQVDKVTYLPIMFLLFQAALRKPADYLLTGKVFLAAAITRSLLAIYIMTWADLGGATPPWATTHHDSMLFACGIVILASLAIHRAHPAAMRLLLLLGPILVWAIVANNRRTAWVQIPLVFVTVFFAMPDNPVKRRIKKLALLSSPFMLLYIVVGWRSAAPFFKPVSSIRSVVEPAPDVSTLTRDIENYCLAKTLGSAPIFGLGYGHRWFPIVSLPPMPHPLEPWLPHNSLLGLWFAAGFAGYTAITLLWTAGVYFGVRAYRFAQTPMQSAVALVCFGSVLIYLVQCYADLGLGVPTAFYMVSPAFAIAGQLAMKNGAWPAKPAAKPAARPAARVPHRPEPA